MRQPELVPDNTLAALYALTARLTQMLAEAEALHVRLVKARVANVWPELRSPSVYRLAPSADARTTL
jgi:hypothetical protein